MAVRDRVDHPQQFLGSRQRLARLRECHDAVGSRGWAGAQQWAMAGVPALVSVGLLETASADVIKLGDTITYTLKATETTAQPTPRL